MTTHPTTDEYARLQHAAHQMLDAADQAARNNDPATEQRAEAAAARLLNATNQIGGTQ